MKSIITAIALSVLAIAGRAQAPGPEVVAKAQLDALIAADWAAFTAQMHPKALARFRELMLPVAEAVTASNDPSAAPVWRSVFSTLPMEKLRATTAAEFFEMFMRNLAKANPAFVENYKTMKVEFLGNVREGTAVHLVSRTVRELAGVKITTMSAATFEPDEAGAWRAMLSGELEQTAAMLRKQFVR
jgi:hypothetical protein